MKACCICRNSITGEEPAVFFVGRNFDNKEICPECEKQLDILMESNEAAKLKEAVNYLYTCSLSADDPEVVSHLKEAIEMNASGIEEAEEAQIKSRPVDTAQKQDYFSDNRSEDDSGSIWIPATKAIALITFVGIIVGGIAFAAQAASAGIGFLVFLGAAFLAFSSLALTMVIINTAKDVSEIKSILNKKK